MPFSARKVIAAEAGVSEGIVHQYFKIKGLSGPETLERVNKKA